MMMLFYKKGQQSAQKYIARRFFQIKKNVCALVLNVSLETSHLIVNFILYARIIRFVKTFNFQIFFFFSSEVEIGRRFIKRFPETKKYP